VLLGMGATLDICSRAHKLADLAPILVKQGICFEKSGVFFPSPTSVEGVVVLAGRRSTAYTAGRYRGKGVF
jgi:hypothetical protein